MHPGTSGNGTAASARIPFNRLVAYATLQLPLAMAALPVVLNVSKFYGEVLKLSLEIMGPIFIFARLVDVDQLDPGVLRGERPGERPIAVPGRSWPVFMSFTRGRDQQQRPLFTLKTQLFDSGVLDRLTIETGLVTVTADLAALEMRKPPSCPRS